MIGAIKNNKSKMNLPKLWIMVIISSTLFMSACSKVGNEGNVDINTPLDKYTPIQRSKFESYHGDFIFVYYAFCNCPVNYEEIAEHTLKDYMGTKDAFQKREILGKFKSEIDSKLAQIKANRYIKLDSEMTMFQSYDFKTKSFPNFKPMSSEYTVAPQLSDTSFPQLELKYIKVKSMLNGINVPNETEAHNVESLRASSNVYRDLRLVLYGYVQSVGIDELYQQNLYGILNSGNNQKRSRIVITIQPIKYSFNVGGYRDPFGDTLAGPYSVN